VVADYACGDSSSRDQVARRKVVGNDRLVLIRSIASAERDDDLVSWPQSASPPGAELKMLVLTKPRYPREYQVARMGTYIGDRARDVREIDASHAVRGLCLGKPVDGTAI
jgi:hypothetical protein